MGREDVLMSGKEIDRLGVVRKVAARRLRQREAAERLGMSVRQVQRLVRRYRGDGAAGLVSRRRGRAPNNVIDAAVRREVMDWVRKRYADFGPTLACEKLTEVHGYRLSAETLRQWMVADGLWKAKSRRKARVHQRRPRRACFGELVQLDGSPHAWFEGRGERCTLVVFIDDATGRLLYLRFVPAETTEAYMEALGVYLGRYGRPAALYSDRHSIFRVNHGRQEGKVTQFTRAVKTLDIEPIQANTPQTKGRVERANQTLQDRLAKELRLEGVGSMEAGNAFPPSFMEGHNRRFAVAPKSGEDAHRAVLHDAEEPGLILRRHAARKLSKNLTFQYLNREYQIIGQGKGYRLRGASVTVCDAFGREVSVLCKGRPLAFRVLAEGEAPVALDDGKSVRHTVNEAKARQLSQPNRKPPADHPWNRMIRSDIAEAEARRGAR